MWAAKAPIERDRERPQWRETEKYGKRERQEDKAVTPSPAMNLNPSFSKPLPLLMPQHTYSEGDKKRPSTHFNVAIALSKDVPCYREPSTR